MSIRVMNRVWTESKAEGGELLLLLAIADHAGDDGIAFPTLSHLATKSRQNLRTVQRQLVELETRGELKIKRGVGRGNRSTYHVLPPKTKKQPQQTDEEQTEKAVEENSEATETQATQATTQPEETAEKVTDCHLLEEQSADGKGDKKAPKKVAITTAHVRNNRHEPSRNTHTKNARGRAGVSAAVFDDQGKAPPAPPPLDLSAVTEALDRCIATANFAEWHQANAPLVAPQAASVEFIAYHVSEGTQFTTETFALKLWRGWLRNAQKLAAAKANRRAERAASQSKETNNANSPSPIPGAADDALSDRERRRQREAEIFALAGY